MYDVKDFLERALRQHRNMMKICEKQLRSLPEGNLSVYQKNGRNYYNKYDQGSTIYLGNENQHEVQELMKRKILFHTAERMKHNEQLMMDFLEAYQDPNPESVRESLGQAYQSEQIDLFSVHKRKSKLDWGDQPYRRSEKYPEQLTHKTMKGDMVRSKSEVIIANTYFIKNAQYRYEEITEIGSKYFAPDFKVLIPRINKIKMHEHFGRMDDPEYRRNAMWKIEYYITNGYRPYEDILFTFDDLDGNIDAQALDRLITNFMM
ncbi:MAG: hypothetical protein IKJ77_09185 [Firmicutes bacterium]|nr:hypothetical protein [Bacillota bacterium]